MYKREGVSVTYRNRNDAGIRLADELCKKFKNNVLVLGLPRGGVPVAFPVAVALRAPLDVLVARKLGAPGQPELGIGAIAPGGVRVINQSLVHSLGITAGEIEVLVRNETAELNRRLIKYRGNRPFPEISGRTVILVDDGLATGFTAKAAIRSVRMQNPGRLIFAAPVCALDSAKKLESEVDELICLETPVDFGAVGYWYDDFSQTTDEEVLALLTHAQWGAIRNPGEYWVTFPVQEGLLEGFLNVPDHAKGVVLFAHGSGSSRHSPRNQSVARELALSGFATLLMDLLTPEEEEKDFRTGAFRFDIPLLSERLVLATEWLNESEATAALPVGYFGASTGAAAALEAAARKPEKIKAVVSRGGRPDMAALALPRVKAPTLLIVGGKDRTVLELNRKAFSALSSVKKLQIVAGATHLFEEPGALEEVAHYAREWFLRYLASVKAVPVA